jgi:hypothetical protein
MNERWSESGMVRDVVIAERNKRTSPRMLSYGAFLGMPLLTSEGETAAERNT